MSFISKRNNLKKLNLKSNDEILINITPYLFETSLILISKNFPKQKKDYSMNLMFNEEKKSSIYYKISNQSGFLVK